MKILIVDDEIEICKRLKSELKREGCKVEYTTSSVDIITRLYNAKTEGEPYELILLDLRMPKVSGFEVLKEIREAGLDLDAIIITGYGDQNKAIEAIHLGAIDYLRKPVSLEDLRTSIFHVKQKREKKKEKALKHRILVVDDEKDLCERVKRELGKEGYEVAVAYDGIEGLDYFSSNHVDAVITDIRMPRMNGLEMLEKCREIKPDFVSIIMTGFGDHEKAIASLRLGTFNYLIKPISLEKLVTSVNEGIGVLLLRRSLSVRKRELEIETALKTRYTEKIKREKRFTENIVATIPDSLLVLDKDLRIKRANRSFFEIFQYEIDYEKVIGSSIAEILHDKDGRLSAELAELFGTEGMLEKFELHYKSEKLGERIFNVTAKGIIIEEEELIVLADITERKRAEEEVEQSCVRLQETLEGTINTLALTVEIRDPYTAGHQLRVAQITHEIAMDLGLSEEQIRGIHMASLIHDLGKISVPAEILSKPGKLTVHEFNLLKSHSQVGSDILKNVSFPWPIAQIILQHHERMDGSGYPQCLKGEEILLEARIIGVADVVEAMASHRPYRPALGIDKALDEISKNKSILYDPDVVDACLRVFKENRFEFN